MEAAGVEPASATNSYRTSTCVAPLLCFIRAGERATRSQTSYPNISSSVVIAPTENQLDLSTLQWFPSSWEIKKRARKLSYAAIAISVLAITSFPRGLTRARGPRHADPYSLITSKPWRPPNHIRLFRGNKVTLCLEMSSRKRVYPAPQTHICI